jgi:hypothetical protein
MTKKDPIISLFIWNKYLISRYIYIYNNDLSIYNLVKLMFGGLSSWCVALFAFVSEVVDIFCVALCCTVSCSVVLP